MEVPASILVVDDDESNRESLRRRLERRGYTVSVAVDGQAALDQVATKAFDLIILDVMMPGINGMEVLDVLRKSYTATQLPIIMATARDQSDDVATALDRGANDYVTKPLDFTVVSARVRMHLQLKQSMDKIVALETDLQARNVELNTLNRALTLNAQRTAHELQAAAKVQKAFLPQANPCFSGVRFSWIYEPCTELAGDSLNVVQLDDAHVALYVLDVSGHGVAASLLAVTITKLLSPSASGDSLVSRTAVDGTRLICAPREVATRLTKIFPMDFNTQFITLFYAVYNTGTRDLVYVSAGHPGAIHLTTDRPPCILDGTGLPIGVGDDYEQQTVNLSPGDRVYLYSDGVTEAMDPQFSLFGTERLLHSLKSQLKETLTESIASLKAEVLTWQAGAAAHDDITILGMECI
jgi:sigma-B regulation protein RsbU (phosphoserine phosphatase)